MQGTADKTLKTGSGKERNNLMKNYHPTVKPIKLGFYLLTMFSRPGDLVLEPFCGSGSFCISAKITQRQYIGIDMDANFCSIAEARLEAYEPAPLPTYFKRSKRPYKDKKSLDATVQRELDF